MVITDWTIRDIEVTALMELLKCVNNTGVEYQKSFDM